MERTILASLLFILVTVFLLPRQVHSYRIIIDGESHFAGIDKRSSSRSDDVVVNCQRNDLFGGSCVDQSKVKVTTDILVGSNDVSCTNIQLEAADCSTDEVELCYNMTTSHWYGGQCHHI